jgi:transcriptional regulator with PAS, ATPase and Fis domain
MIDFMPTETYRPSVDEIATALASAGLSKCCLNDLESAAILNALRHCDGNRTHAAQLLGISTRKVQRWIKRREFQHPRLAGPSPPCG